MEPKLLEWKKNNLASFGSLVMHRVFSLGYFLLICKTNIWTNVFSPHGWVNWVTHFRWHGYGNLWVSHGAPSVSTTVGHILSRRLMLLYSQLQKKPSAALRIFPACFPMIPLGWQFPLCCKHLCHPCNVILLYHHTSPSWMPTFSTVFITYTSLGA